MDARFIHSFPLEGGAFQDMDFGEDNLLYVLDQSNPVILKIDPESGQVLDLLGEEALAQTTPRGISLDGSGNFYISGNSSESGAAIYVLDPQGSLERLLGRLTNAAEPEWPEGTFFDPRGIAVTSDGSFLFLCDGMRSRAYLTAYKLNE
jgi:DNA-binding beta-propeller fold protein YncE